MKERFIGGIIFAIVSVIMLFFMGFIGQVAYVAIIIAIGLKELISMWRVKKVRASERLYTVMFGIVAVCVGALVLILFHANTWYVFFPVVIVVGSDSFALFGGKLFGKTKIFPNTSPNKTVEGAFCGILGALVLAGLFYIWFPAIDAALDFSLLEFIVFVVLVAAAGIVGDYCESKLERIYGVKDSGSFIKGHGGILDRADGYLGGMVVAIILYIFS